MNFEWDEAKCRLNIEKHGISFEEAGELWSGFCITSHSIAKSKDGEFRNATLGMLKGKVVVAIWTKRKESIRLISIRRARDEEKELFYARIQHQ